MNEWYFNYINIDQEKIFAILLAANILNIQSLLELCSAKLASNVEKMDAKGVHEFFNIEFDPSKEAAFNERNDWAEEVFSDDDEEV